PDNVRKGLLSSSSSASRKGFDRYRDTGDNRGYGAGGDRGLMQRSESFVGLGGIFRRAFGLRGTGLGGKVVCLRGGDLERVKRCKVKSKSPSWSKDSESEQSKSEQSKSVEVKKTEELQVESRSSSEMEEGELEPEPMPETEPEKASDAAPKNEDQTSIPLDTDEEIQTESQLNDTDTTMHEIMEELNKEEAKPEEVANSAERREFKVELAVARLVNIGQVRASSWKGFATLGKFMERLGNLVQVFAKRWHGLSKYMERLGNLGHGTGKFRERCRFAGKDPRWWSS
ncbi:hypothetical protein K1719_047620, partial [Acacia pycnantha]